MQTDFGYFEEKKLGKKYDLKILKRLYPFAMPHKLLFVCSIFLIVLITLLDLALPFVTKIAIDRYIVPEISLHKPSGHNMESIHDMQNSKPEKRYYRANLNDAGINKIISSHPQIFLIEEPFAFISFENLSKLSKEELALLRKKDLWGIGFFSSAFIIIVMLNFAFAFAHTIIMEYAGQKIMHDLRVRMFTHIQSLNLSFFNRNPVGRLVTRVTNDVQNMHELFTSVLTFVFKDIFLLAGIAIVLLKINTRLALLSFIVLPPVFIISIYFSSKSRDVFRILRLKTAEINTNFSETIEGIKILQLFLHEKENFKKFAKLNHEHYNAGMSQTHIFAVFMPVIELLGAFALALIIYFGGNGVITGGMSLGALVAFISYIKMFFRPIRDIAEKYNIMQNAISSAERMFLILDTKNSLTPENIQTAEKSGFQEDLFEKIELIEFNGVMFNYIKDEAVLKNISFKLHSGETMAVAGSTGSGKTSLVNLLLRFYNPVSGAVLINGIDIKNINIEKLRSKTALVTQDPFLFSGTIRENIIFGNRNISKKKLAEVIEASNCTHMIEKLPRGLATRLGEDGESISSGEKQLISIARAFARNPELIILDEATSYIDSETEIKIQEALSNLTGGKTSVIVAHRLSTARSADRIIVLNKGKIIESGSHLNLMEQKGFYFRLNQLQI